MSVGPGPNLSGGLWMSAIAASPPTFFIGAANTGSQLDCAGSPPGTGSPPSSSGTCNSPSGGAPGSPTGPSSGEGPQDWAMQQSSGNGVVFAQSVGTNPIGSPWPGCGCPPSPGGPNPVAVTNSGAYGLQIEVVSNRGYLVSVPVTCTQNGLTLPSGCGTTGSPFPVFWFSNNTETVGFTVPGGAYSYCNPDYGGGTFGSGSTTGTPGHSISPISLS